MTKSELSKYAGVTFYNLSTRPGGMFRTISRLTLYKVTGNGTCKYLHEVMGCVANKKQYAHMNWLTDGLYHSGRPFAANLTKEFLEANKITY